MSSSSRATSAPTKGGKSAFTVFAQGTATAAGSAPAFMIAIGLVLLWAVTGPLFHFSMSGRWSSTQARPS